MPLTLSYSPFLLALCALAAAGLAYWAYRRTVPALSPRRRAVLVGLRWLSLFIVLFLLFEPVLRRVQRDERPPVLAVLVDESQSLGLRGDTTSDVGGGADVAGAVRETLRRLPVEDVRGEVRLFTFSSGARAIEDGRGGLGRALDTLSFRGERTDIARALGDVREALSDQNLRGVLLVSDGQYNTGRNPLYLAERYPVPIHTVVVGDTTARRDVAIRRVTTNEIAYVGTQLPVQVGLRAVDYAGARVSVALLRGGEVLQSQTADLAAGATEVPVDLAYEPAEAGLQRLTVAVTRLNGEATYRNNTASFNVRVLESRQRVLLLAAAPGPDVAALHGLLETDPNADVTLRVQKERGAFYGGLFPDSLDAFDAIVLAGYPGAVADPAEVQRVAEAAAGGTPLLFLLSRQTDLDLLNQSLADVLPVTAERVRGGFMEATPQITPAGAQHPILDDLEAEAAVLRRLPPLAYNESRWQASPDARVLATVEVRGVPLDDPLLVIRSRGAARSAALLGAGTWRWRNLPEDLDQASPFWPNLLSNLLRWVTTREDDRPVRVEPIEETFAGGEPVSFTGQVYDESLEPVEGASVKVEITAPDGARYPYSMESVGEGRYVLDAGAFPEGTYAYRATAQRGGTDLGEDRGAFAVGGLTLEFRETRADAPLMRQIAQRSGGDFFAPGDVGAIPVRLAASERFTPVVFEEERSVELWRRYAFLIAVIVLLAAEWFLRKRNGMV